MRTSWIKYANERPLFSHIRWSFLVTNMDYPAQCGHIDFDHAKSTVPGSFIIESGDEPWEFWIADGSNNIFYIPTE